MLKILIRMDDNIRAAIMRSTETFVAEFDPNENRRVDINSAKKLVAKLGVRKNQRECPICCDSNNNSKISKLPCCSSYMCQPCIVANITQNSKDCPMCRADLIEKINAYITNKPRDDNTNDNESMSKYKYTVVKYEPIKLKDPDNAKTIKIRTYNLNCDADAKAAENALRKRLEIIYHNNTDENRKKFEDFLENYKNKLENSSIKNELEKWKQIRQSCKQFTDKHKFSPKYVSDSIIHKHYSTIMNIMNSN